MAARAEGALVITDTCVFLEHEGERMLLVWPVDRTSWDSSQRTITVGLTGADPRPAASGDQVVLAGGATFDDSESDLTSDEWLARMDWVAPPEPECLTPTRWEVANIDAVGGT
jgi:hypothetical protein